MIRGQIYTYTAYRDGFLVALDVDIRECSRITGLKTQTIHRMFCRDGGKNSKWEIHREKVMNDGNWFRFDLWLYNEMKKRDMTAKELAQKAELSYTAITLFLRGDRNPTLYSFQKILRAFGLHLEVVQD